MSETAIHILKKSLESVKSEVVNKNLTLESAHQTVKLLEKEVASLMKRALELEEALTELGKKANESTSKNKKTKR